VRIETIRSQGKISHVASSHRDGDGAKGVKFGNVVVRESYQGLELDQFLARLRGGSGEAATHRSLVVAEEWLREVALCYGENGKERLQ
jgi:hypothetical protein